jgi:apolipoprotein N-acyltransferase
VAQASGTNGAKPRPTSAGAQAGARSEEASVSFLLYLFGFIVFIAGLAWLATVLGISQTYVMIGAVILLGIGIFSAASRTRAKDPPAG